MPPKYGTQMGSLPTVMEQLPPPSNLLLLLLLRLLLHLLLRLFLPPPSLPPSFLFSLSLFFSLFFFFFCFSFSNQKKQTSAKSPATAVFNPISLRANESGSDGDQNVDRRFSIRTRSKMRHRLVPASVSIETDQTESISLAVYFTDQPIIQSESAQAVRIDGKSTQTDESEGEDYL